ncbi:MAG TPA: VWA domain-containing protein [Pyrinomonadaceae bacterium]|jgi:VWFA-related protein|nr:VWA domain-containing protein [Pyrinomonadaceae bacterium]
MRYFSRTLLVLLLSFTFALSQTPQTRKPGNEVGQDEVIRITTQLVQTNVVVVDSKDRVVPDLSMADFELYDNGKKQELKFLEFVSVDTGRRTEGKRPTEVPASAVENDNLRGVSAKEVKRVIAFVVDDLSIPISDLPSLRKLLLDFVNNQMLDGDLVAVVRVIGGKGLLQQFTSDRTILRKAIAAINPISHPLSAVGGPQPGRIDPPTQLAAGVESTVEDMPEADTTDIFSPTDDANQYARGLLTLSTAGFVIESLKEIPGNKNMVIISGGVPIFDPSTGHSIQSLTYLLQRLSDLALRAGVTINTMDPRGLNASPGAVSFTETEGRSNYQAEIMGTRRGFGRGGIADQETLSPLLAGASERLGLGTIARITGGVSVANTNDFGAGLNKILARSRGYYLLAYTPTEKFDRKYHELKVKVKRPDVRVFHHDGYAAREDRPLAERTKEEQIVAAARSPLAKRDIEVSPNIAIKLVPETNKATVEVHILIDPKKLNFAQENGQYSTSLDVVGFVLDELGKQRGGFSETLDLKLSKENYDRAQSGLIYTAPIDLPPGNFQLRSVVRERSSGSLGTFSKYLEIPDQKKDALILSSLFLFAVEGSQPAPLTAIRRVSRNQDVRYAVLIYNPKLKDGQAKLTSQLLISQGEKVLLREPEEPVQAVANTQYAKIGQFGVSKMQPGRYVLTVTITDTLADKKRQTISRSLDFTVVP